jgi:hypothetical protein
MLNKEYLKANEKSQFYEKVDFSDINIGEGDNDYSNGSGRYQNSK